MTKLPPIIGRVAALSILLGLVLLASALGVQPIFEKVRVVDDALQYNRDMVERLSRSLASSSSYDAPIDAVQVRVDESELYIRADTEPLAAAAVQEFLKRAVGLHGGELRSVQSLPSLQEDDLTRVGLRVVMTGQFSPMIRILYELETGEPYLFVDNLQIKSTTRRRRRKQQPAIDTLSIRFDVFGYLPPEAVQ